MSISIVKKYNKMKGNINWKLRVYHWLKLYVLKDVFSIKFIVHCYHMQCLLVMNVVLYLHICTAMIVPYFNEGLYIVAVLWFVLVIIYFILVEKQKYHPSSGSCFAGMCCMTEKLFAHKSHEFNIELWAYVVGCNFPFIHSSQIIKRTHTRKKWYDGTVIMTAM